MRHGIYRVVNFEIVGPLTLMVRFDDSTCQTIDFSPALKGSLYGALRDQDYFRRVGLDPEAHTLVWPNGADFDPATLHDWHLTSWAAQATKDPVANRVAEDKAGYGADGEKRGNAQR